MKTYFSIYSIISLFFFSFLTFSCTEEIAPTQEEIMEELLADPLFISTLSDIESYQASLQQAITEGTSLKHAIAKYSAEGDKISLSASRLNEKYENLETLFANIKEEGLAHRPIHRSVEKRGDCTSLLYLGCTMGCGLEFMTCMFHARN